MMGFIGSLVHQTVEKVSAAYIYVVSSLLVLLGVYVMAWVQFGKTLLTYYLLGLAYCLIFPYSTGTLQ